MSVPYCLPAAGLQRFAALSTEALAAMLLAGLVSGCAAVPPSPFAGPNPADPAAPVPAVGVRSTIGPYLRQRPVEPAPWREQNDRVAPAPKE